MHSPQRLLVTCGVFLVVAGCRSCEPDRPRARPPAPVLDRTTVLAELPAEEKSGGAPAPGKDAGTTARAPATAAHVPPAPTPEFTFSEQGGGVVWVAQEKDGKYRVFHNGRAGPPFAEVGNVALSRDGLHHAYGGLVGDDWRLMRDGKEGPLYKDLGYLVYSPDGAKLVFQAKVGDAFQLMVDGKPYASAPADYLAQNFSADSSKLVFHEPVDREVTSARVAVVDLASGARTIVEPNALLMTVSADRTRVAAVAAVEGGMHVLTFDPARPDRVRRGRKYDRVAGVEFGRGGFPLAYFALRGREQFVVVEEDEIPLPMSEIVVGGAAPRPGERGFGALVRTGDVVTFRQYLMAPAPAEASYEEALGLAYGPDGRSHAYVARRGASWFVVANGKEGPAFDSVTPPAFSPDGNLVVYRARREGKRFVVLADREGKTLRELPPYEQVFDVHFTADGKSIAYGVKDGRQLAWKVDPL